MPISHLAECITETQKELGDCLLPAPIVGHVGDGNFHVGFVLNPNDPGEMEQARRLNEKFVHRALSLKWPFRDAARCTVGGQSKNQTPRRGNA